MSKKSKKGKTMPLTDYLASEPKLVTVRESTWAAIVDEEEAQKKPIVVNMSGLPTAPRSAVDVDYSTIPNNPPFVAHIANLSFEIDDEDLRRIFVDLKPITARIMREGNRSRGVGLVEFETRESLVEALKRTDKEVYGRKIRINISDKTDLHQTDGNRGNFNYRSNRTGEERPEMADRWQRIERKSDELSDDRPRNDFNRDRPNRSDHGRSNFTGNSRDNQRGSDYGFGYPRTREDRQGPRQRYNNDDDHRPNSSMDRPRYPARSSDTNDGNNTPNGIDHSFFFIWMFSIFFR
jgi:translation initiation factor 4B